MLLCLLCVHTLKANPSFASPFPAQQDQSPPQQRPATPLRDFISLTDSEPQNPATKEGSVEEGESFEDSLLRRTREFNELTRTRPQDLQAWLDFAAFQDEFLKVGRKKEVVQALDKKLAIYEKVRRNGCAKI